MAEYIPKSQPELKLLKKFSKNSAPVFSKIEL